MLEPPILTPFIWGSVLSPFGLTVYLALLNTLAYEAERLKWLIFRIGYSLFPKFPLAVQ